MKLIKQTRLFFKEGKSDKVYEVDLCELSSTDNDRYLVNFRYGRRGQNLREGTKTPEPCSLERAQKLFDSVVISKTNKGYSESGEPAPTAVKKETPKPTVSVAAVSDRLAANLQKEKNSRRRARIIWRLGELGDKSRINDICINIGKGHWLEDYSIAWALGRLGGEAQLALISQLLQSSQAQVKSIAAEAELLMLSEQNRKAKLEQEIGTLPESIKIVVNSNLAKHEQVKLLTEWFRARQANQTLCTLYRLCLLSSELKESFVELLKSIPLKPGFFAGIRHIYKAAELRLDAEVFGVLTYRFETSKAYFTAEWGWYYDIESRRSIEVKKELVKPDSKLAYSSKTRDYLRRRSWRSIKRLAQLQIPNYVDMAVGILSQMSDENAAEPRTNKIYGWNEATRNYEVVSTNFYGRYAGFLSFNHILHGNSANYQLAKSRRAWIRQGEKDLQIRHEAFPELWDQHPEKVIDLLLKSQCEPVHQFACRVLLDNADFCQGIDNKTLIILLQAKYPSTCEFALNIIRAKLNEAAFHEDLALGLAACQLEDARQLAIEYLDKNFDSWSKSLTAITTLVLNPFEGVQQWLINNVARIRLDFIAQKEIASALVSACIQSNELSPAQATFIINFFRNQLSDVVADLDLLLIESLLSSDKQWLQQIGAGLLVANKIPFNDIADSIKNAITTSEYSEIRAIGIELLGKQNIRELIEQTQVIVNLFKSGDAQERQAVIKLVNEPCRQSEEFAQKFFGELIQLAFKGESEEGQHQDLETLCAQILKNNWHLIENDVLWRLLLAKSKAAQKIGAAVLKDRPSEIYSVAQWAALAKNAQKSVRDWSINAFNQNTQLVKEKSKAALAICEAPWLEIREFAFEFFDNHFDESIWNPELVLYICDSNRDDVQAFGRAILQKFFKQEQGEEYLLKLSQHPSENVQLFASSFLREYAANRPENILQLKRYFITVLSLVNRGRVCKDRVLKFLLHEAQLDNQVAALVADVFSRQSVTSVIKDKSTLIQALLKLRQLYPDLELPLIQVQKPIWQKTREA